ncbi:4Fe-4S ferredoxin iron-sulfur binding protein [Blattabacterium sp. (Blattella germanica) str. Bge]|uniref:4Fe-4S binding protein n=1 Tax=Blattabacterium sp. (Blattella germanica) TaxID=624186 RepID=UPI0001BB60E5|nr:4Fe-4S dicluster domain-containing protein [Blattabacterium sp. (Blattella germanica)]ACY40175.1 4Fe-4S ferredoxin iron-sulfur binding protein [Blattabacterium sp. (Blattella germanica) str. Bge]
MSIKITEECINCGACEPECPNHAIYEGGKKWRMSDGTSLREKGSLIDQVPKEKNIYFIVSEKCTECVGFYDEPQCVVICPVNCCIPDPNNMETKEELVEKKLFLHGIN